MKSLKNLKWQKKVVLSIICAIIAVVGLLFMITYVIFVDRLRENDEKIARLNFAQAEENLEDLLQNAFSQENSYNKKHIAWEFSKEDYSMNSRNASLNKEIISDFEEILDTNRNLYSCAQLNGNGTTILCSAQGKSHTGITKITGSLYALLEQCQGSYPQFMWVSGEDVEIDSDSILYSAVDIPVLMGICAMDAGIDVEDNSYIIFTIRESAISNCYEAVIYNNSQAVLVDKNEKIISSTSKDLLGAQFEEGEGYQIVEYPLSYNEWKMINRIPQNNYQNDARYFRNFAVGISLAATCCVIVIAMCWSRKYTKPIQILMNSMNEVGKENFDIEKPERAGWPELDSLNRNFYDTVQKLKTYMEKLKTSEHEKAKEELLALQYQINPHFLYNSLNSIRWMAMMTNNTKVADALVRLSKIIRPVFRNPSFTWKIKDEIEFLDNYIEIMSIRYGETLDYKMQCEEELKEEIIPRFVLQPVLENCFVHGNSKGGMRKISVTIARVKSYFCIEVRNNADQVDRQKLASVTESLKHMENIQKEEVGLYNVAKRLHLLYGDRSQIVLYPFSDQEVVVRIVYGSGAE